MSKKLKAAVYDRDWNRGDLSVMDELFSPEYRADGAERSRAARASLMTLRHPCWSKRTGRVRWGSAGRGCATAAGTTSLRVAAA
jgi:hypothetical protein